MAVANLIEAGGNKTECFVPRYFMKLTITPE